MKTDLSDRALDRIWTYNVFPLIEEQLWGDRDEIARWRWDQVRRRFATALSGLPAADPRTGDSGRRPVTDPRPPDQQLARLPEYGTADVQLTVAQARALRHLARGRLAISPGDAEGSWHIKASSYVGTIVTPGLRLLIVPKVTTANLFYLLEASGRPLDTGPAQFDYEQARDLVPSFATFYARHLETALTQGVPRAYQERQERLTGVRGRIDLPAQLRLAGLPLPAECRFDDYTADIPPQPDTPRRRHPAAPPPRRHRHHPASAAAARRPARRSRPSHPRGSAVPHGVHPAEPALPRRRAPRPHDPG